MTGEVCRYITTVLLVLVCRGTYTVTVVVARLQFLDLLALTLQMGAWLEHTKATYLVGVINNIVK